MLGIKTYATASLVLAEPCNGLLQQPLHRGEYATAVGVGRRLKGQLRDGVPSVVPENHLAIHMLQRVVSV